MSKYDDMLEELSERCAVCERDASIETYCAKCEADVGCGGVSNPAACGGCTACLIAQHRWSLHGENAV